MKLSVIYDSRTGNTEAAAAAIADGMREVEGTEVRTFHMKEVDTAFVRESTGVVFGTPTYVAGPTADFYSWFEKDSKELGLAGKLGGPHGQGDDDLFRRSCLRKAGDPPGAGGDQPGQGGVPGSLPDLRKTVCGAGGEDPRVKER